MGLGGVLMSYFNDLNKAILEGREGKNKGIQLGMPRLDRYVTLRKKLYYMIMGSTGSGKSSLLYDAFILNPLDIMLETESKMKLKYILFSMERSKIYIQAKWLIRKIFLMEGTLIPISKLLKWGNDSLSDEEYELVRSYEDYFNFLEAHIDIYEGAHSPDNIFRIVKNYALDHGEDEQIDEFKRIYKPKDENELVVVAADHFGLTRTSKKHPTKKQAIDGLSENFQYFRDHLHYSVIGVNQLNRDMSNPIYTKMDSFEPHLDNAKETGNTTEAADVVLSLFDPLRFKTNDMFYGDVTKFKCPETGHKYFRNIKVLKNSYGIDDASIGVVFQGETGTFAQLPKSQIVREEWKDYNFKEIFTNNYFLKK